MIENLNFQADELWAETETSLRLLRGMRQVFQPNKSSLPAVPSSLVLTHQPRWDR